jgi:hypothetical protein
MEGRIDDTLQSLTDAMLQQPSDRHREVVALGALRAELLHLDHRHEAAASVIDNDLAPHLSALTAQERLGVEQNLSDVQRSSSISHELFYNLYDQKRLLNFEWLDYRDLFEARQDADRGKHYKALPILWQQHRRAYLHGCWLVQRWTNHLLASECVHLKEWEDAAHYAVLGRYNEILKDIAEGILLARDVNLVERVVKKLVGRANLKAHFVVACNLLTALKDAIPDDQIPQIGKWVLERASETNDVVIGENPVLTAWNTIASIGHRFPIDLAQSTVGVAITHPTWTTKLDDPNRFCPGRQEIVRSVISLCAALPTGDIPSLATASLPLLTERPQIPDYRDVIELLCDLAQLGGVAVRDSLAACLYPTNQPISRDLMQVSDVFGKVNVFDSARLQRLAHQVTQEIRRQVQWLDPDQTGEPVAEVLMEHTTQAKGRILKIYAVGFSGLHALVKHRAGLDESTLQSLLDAMLELACNRDNFCINRTGLLQALIGLGDSVPATGRSRIRGELEKLAQGAVEESSAYATADEADAPLNTMAIQTGRPIDVQGAALVALAGLASNDAAATRRLEGILEDALCDHRPKIRQAAYSAASRLPDVSDGVILGVLAGLRDPDPSAAGVAFGALARQANWDLNRNHWRVFLMAVRLAQRTGAPALRRVASMALVTLLPRCPTQFARKGAEVLEELRNDICWSVRRQ